MAYETQSARWDLRPIVEYCGGTEIGGGYITNILIVPKNLRNSVQWPGVRLRRFECGGKTLCDR